MPGATRTPEEEFALFLKHQLDAAEKDLARDVQRLKEAHQQVAAIRHWMDVAESKVVFFQNMIRRPDLWRPLCHIRKLAAEVDQVGAEIDSQADAVELGKAPPADPDGSGCDPFEAADTAVHAASREQVNGREEPSK